LAGENCHKNFTSSPNQISIPLIKSENYLKQSKGIIPPKAIRNIENKTNIPPWVALKDILDTVSDSGDFCFIYIKKVCFLKKLLN